MGAFMRTQDRTVVACEDTVETVEEYKVIEEDLAPLERELMLLKEENDQLHVLLGDREKITGHAVVHNTGHSVVYNSGYHSVGQSLMQHHGGGHSHVVGSSGRHIVAGDVNRVSHGHSSVVNRVSHGHTMVESHTSSQHQTVSGSRVVTSGVHGHDGRVVTGGSRVVTGGSHVQGGMVTGGSRVVAGGSRVVGAGSQIQGSHVIRR